MEIRITSQGIEELAKELGNAPKAVRNVLTWAMGRAVNRMVAAIQVAAPQGVTGTLKERGFSGVVVTKGPIVVGIISNTEEAFYAPYVNDGTQGDPPQVSAKALMPWCSLKLGDPKLAYPVAKHIREHGSPGQFFVEKARAMEDEAIEADFKSALDRFLLHG